VTSEVHPWAEADLGDVGTVQITGGAATLDALGVPYATASITIPWSGAIADIDPRDDIRIIIRAGNGGHWVEVPTGYGHSGYGHGPYGHS
jgi:hypothetical protein